MTLRGRLRPSEMFPAGRADVVARYVTLNGGLTVRLAESGETTGTPTLLLHGWGASLYMWRDWFAPLAAAGRRVIAVDLPGHGLSDKPTVAGTYRLAALTSVLRDLLDAEHLSDVDVVAQSMSGTIALELARGPRSPVRKLVLVNPAAFGRLSLQRLLPLARTSIADRILPYFLARWMVERTHRMVYGDPGRLDARAVDETWAPSQFPAFTRATRQMLSEFTWDRQPAEEVAGRLGALRADALVVLGTRDRLVLDAAPYVRALVAAGAPLQLREVPGGGHAVNEELPDVVTALALHFLSSASDDPHEGAQ